MSLTQLNPYAIINIHVTQPLWCPPCFKNVRIFGCRQNVALKLAFMSDGSSEQLLWTSYIKQKVGPCSHKLQHNLISFCSQRKLSKSWRCYCPIIWYLILVLQLKWNVKWVKHEKRLWRVQAVHEWVKKRAFTQQGELSFRTFWLHTGKAVNKPWAFLISNQT